MNSLSTFQVATVGVVAVALSMIAGCELVRAQDAPPLLPPVYPAPAVPAAPPPASPEFQSGFCAGWNAAVQVEQQRYGNWRALVRASRTDEGAKTPVGQTADLLVDSVAVYVLVQQATGQLTLADGRAIACAAAPAAGGAR